MIVRWTRRALLDLQRIADHIASDKSQAAARLVTLIQNKVAALEQFPLLGRTGAYQDTRELVVHRNHLVTYRLRVDEAHVLQVWHVARDVPRSSTRVA